MTIGISNNTHTSSNTTGNTSNWSQNKPQNSVHIDHSIWTCVDNVIKTWTQVVNHLAKTTRLPHMDYIKKKKKKKTDHISTAVADDERKNMACKNTHMVAMLLYPVTGVHRWRHTKKGKKVQIGRASCRERV